MKSEPIVYDAILGRKAPLKPELTVKYYDFRRPDKFSKDQIRTVAIMHETFARLSTTSISAQLRCLTHMHVETVDQLTYEEYIRSIPNPTTLAIINMDPLKGSAVLEIDPAPTFAVIDRLFGGRGKASGLQRDLTDIEQSVMEGIIVRLMGNLREAWSTVLDLRPRLGQIETNPAFAQINPPHEMVIVVFFKCQVGEAEGQISLCLPFLTIEPIIEKLSAQYWYSSVRRDRSKVTRDAGGLKADAQIYFEARPQSLAEVHGLKKNSLVKLNDYSSAQLAVGGKTVCRFLTGRSQGLYVFKVDEAEAPPENDQIFAPDSDALWSKEESGKNESRLPAPWEKWSADMKNALETIAGKIATLQKRQEEMSDQLFNAVPTNGHAADAEPEGSGKPFAFLAAYDADAFYNFISQEHPQTIALILSFLDANAAAGYLSRLGEEEQADIAERIALLERCPPEVIREVERVLEKKLLWSKKESALRPDARTLVNILNVAERRVERNVVDRLEKSNPELAERIKRNMFVFEDVVLLDDKVMALLLPRIDPKDLLFALKAVDEKTKDHFMKNFKPEERKKFIEDFQASGPVRLVDADKAQQRIIGVIREMEEAGEIVIARQGDELVGRET